MSRANQRAEAVYGIGLLLLAAASWAIRWRSSSEAVAPPPSPQEVANRDCSDGGAEACDRAARYREACDLKSAPGCEHGGVEAEQAGSFRHAAAMYERACALGASSACDRRDALYLAGKAAPSDPAEAARWDVTRCEARDVVACAQAGVYYVNAHDDRRALPFLVQACDAGSPPGCWALGRAYAEGRGVPRNDITAVSKYRIACNGDPQYCFDLGRAYEGGRGVARDHAKALALFTQACTAGNADACAAVRAP